MDNQIKRKYRKLTYASIFYFVFALFMTTCVTYAWFTITNVNNAHLVTHISEIEAEYEFFIYQNKTRDGSEELTLYENICQDITEDVCYLNIPNPNSASLIDGSSAPGERYSFAIRITSVNNPIGLLKLDIGDLISFNYDLEVNKIQTAFYYQVDKISYINYNVESEDIKDTYDINYHFGFFTYDNDGIYPLVSNIPMQNIGNFDTMIVIYFNIYFDPTVFGQDALGIAYSNSNIFINQKFTIEHIYMSVSTN